MSETFQIGDRVARPGHAYIIAEAGVNHNGDRDLAHRLVDAAADAGADAVKFQTWITDLICAPGARAAAYQAVRTDTASDQYAMLKRLELPYAWHAALRDHARDRGLDFLSTPDDLESARFLASLGVPVMKVGSAEATNLPHLRAMGSFGLPVIVSTGMTSTDEARAAVEALRDGGAPAVAVLHCVSAYPAPAAELNLRAMATLREMLGVPVGFSDHSEGAVAATVAVGVGMCILEKHITLDRSLPGPDHAASENPTEFAELVRRVRLAEAMLGTGEKRMSASEADTRRAVRRVLVYANDVHAGDRLVASAVRAVRTGGDGFEPNALAEIMGRTLARDVSAGTVVSRDDLLG